MAYTYTSKSLFNFSNSSNYLMEYRSFQPKADETHSFVNPPSFFVVLASPSYESTAIPAIIKELNGSESFLIDSFNCNSQLKKIKDIINNYKAPVNEEKTEMYIKECMKKAKDNFINLFKSSDIPDISKSKDFFKKAYSLSDDKNINIYIDYESVAVNINYKNKAFTIEQYFEDSEDVVITCLNMKKSAISVCNYNNMQLYMDKY